MQSIDLDSATIIIFSWENRFAAAGGVKAVTQEYAKHLVSEGRNTLVITPLHIGLENQPGEVMLFKSITFKFDGVEREISIHEEEWEGVRWVYLKCNDFFKAEGGRDQSNPYLYTHDAKEEALGNGSPLLVRDSLFFAAVMPRLLTALKIEDNLVLHLQDWETCAVALTIKDAVDKQEFGRIVSSLALHNPYDSRMNPSKLKTDGWNLISERAIPTGVPSTFLGRLILFIDAPPTTVSHEFAVDLMNDPLQTEHLADHLQPHFKRRKITGVDNGPFGYFKKPFTEDAIRDAREGNPNAILKEKVELRQRMIKSMCDYRPHQRWGDIDFDTLLSPDKSTAPVFVCVGRLDEGQKGYDVLTRAIEVLLKEDFDGYFILTPIVGNAPQPYVDDLEQLGKNFKGRVVIYPMHMDKGYLEIQAGSSFSLWPSMYEPFGAVSEFLLQGTPVIARSTGGLRQQITNFDNESGKGNGVLYETCHPDPGTSFHHGTWCQNEWKAIQKEEYPLCRKRYPVYMDQVVQLVEAIARGVEILNDQIAYGRLLSNLYDSVSGYSWTRTREEYFKNYVRR